MCSYFPVPLPLIFCYSSRSQVGWNMPKLLFTIITSPGYRTVNTRLPEAARILLEPMTPSSFYSKFHNRTACDLSCFCSSSLATCLIISIFIVNAWLSSKFTKGSRRLSFVKICFSFNSLVNLVFFMLWIKRLPVSEMVLNMFQLFLLFNNNPVGKSFKSHFILQNVYNYIICYLHMEDSIEYSLGIRALESEKVGFKSWFLQKMVFFFVFHHPMRHTGSQFPNQGSNPCPPALGARSPNHWTAREVPPIVNRGYLWHGAGTPLLLYPPSGLF